MRVLVNYMLPLLEWSPIWFLLVVIFILVAGANGEVAV